VKQLKQLKQPKQLRSALEADKAAGSQELLRTGPESAEVYGGSALAAAISEFDGSMMGWPRAQSPFWKALGRSRKPPMRKPRPHWELQAFFASTVAGQWVFFACVWLVLMRISVFVHQMRLVSWVAHVIALFVWTFAAMLYLLWIYCTSGSSLASVWLDGYVMELVLSMENIFLYQMILVAFKVPARIARYALLLVSLWQMVFQMFMFMGIAAWIQDMEVLPYLLGAWLILVGLQTMRDDSHEDESFDASASESYKMFGFALGDRLLPNYETDGRVFVYKNGRLSVTMMGPVVCCLLAIMFAMEVDVTLTKIEEIDNHFIAWSSSVLAVFALPELYVVVRELLRRFYLLKLGISLLVLFFGMLLLFRDQFQVSDTAELTVMLSIVVGSIALSALLGYEARDAAVYSEDTNSAKPDESDNKKGLGCKYVDEVFETEVRSEASTCEEKEA